MKGKWLQKVRYVLFMNKLTAINKFRSRDNEFPGTISEKLG